MSKTQFKPGQSGNPKGRPKSALTATDLRQRLARDAEQIIDSVVQAALNGDTQAARLVLERIIPAIKPIEQPVEMPLPNCETLTEHGRAVLSAVVAGELAPGQGAQLVSAIGGLARVVEVDELAARVAELEKRHVKS